MAPVSSANRRGRENTPAPTIEPTTIVVSVNRVSLTAGRRSAAADGVVPVSESVIGSLIDAPCDGRIGCQWAAAPAVTGCVLSISEPLLPWSTLRAGPGSPKTAYGGYDNAPW